MVKIALSQAFCISPSTLTKSIIQNALFYATVKYVSKIMTCQKKSRHAVSYMPRYNIVLAGVYNEPRSRFLRLLTHHMLKKIGVFVYPFKILDNIFDLLIVHILVRHFKIEKFDQLFHIRLLKFALGIFDVFGNPLFRIFVTF